MGDRYVWEQPCPKCEDGVVECAYAESCGIHDGHCLKCKTEFDITMTHVLKEKKNG